MEDQKTKALQFPSKNTGCARRQSRVGPARLKQRAVFLAEIIPSLQAKHLQTISLRLNEMPTFSHEAMWRNLDDALTLSPVIGVDIGLPKETMDSDNERVKDVLYRWLPVLNNRGILRVLIHGQDMAELEDFYDAIY
ncbi:hypothetical protein C8J57DRAFT_1471574 [Mycena rebaudengoi]|nr:hypothetical protein C8J57DRAFT_1471574 [Mycena rebaudengoi]